jgi:hypothetical protein
MPKTVISCIQQTHSFNVVVVYLVDLNFVFFKLLPALRMGKETFHFAVLLFPQLIHSPGIFPQVLL